jgi:beta-fructofuranosidase
MSQDRHRPTYHFSSGQWMNDPIPFFWRGEYHVFYQYNPTFALTPPAVEAGRRAQYPNNPHGAFWGTMHWGHAVSRDLARWDQLPIALNPTPGGPDQDGCFTGCVVRHAGHFEILYTGIPRLKPLQQVQCLASSGDLITWEKHPGDPVIGEPPPGFGECFRDPCAWKEGDTWYMVIGSEQPEGKGGAALLYRSPDLVRWEYLGPLFLGEAAATGHDFECPDFFPLGDRHVLLTSRGKTHWHVGCYADHRFTLERRGVTDGGAFYAAKTLVDDQGRRILFGWIQEQRTGEEQRAAGWSGVLSLPRVLSLLPDGSLGMEPAPELKTLRRRGHHCGFANLTLSDQPWRQFLDQIMSDAFELEVRFAPTDAVELGALVRCSLQGDEWFAISYNRETKKLNDTPLELAPGEGLTLRVFVDRSVIEAFANGRACYTARFYPEREDALRIALFARGGSARVESAEVWNLPSWRTRPG